MRKIQVNLPDEIYHTLQEEKGLCNMSNYVATLLMAYVAGIDGQMKEQEMKV